MESKNEIVEKELIELAKRLDMSIYDIFLVALKMYNNGAHMYKYQLRMRAKRELGITDAMIHLASFEEKQKLIDAIQKMDELEAR